MTVLHITLSSEFEEAAEKASWDLANKNTILGLENRMKNNHIIIETIVFTLCGFIFCLIIGR
jgi:hypothetical protein